MPRTLAHPALVSTVVAAALTLGATIPVRSQTPAPATAMPPAAGTPAPEARAPVPLDPPILLEVDATDLDHKVFAVRQTLPVRPGPLRLLFPLYLPGQHGPWGEVRHLGGLRMQAGGRELPWLRDPADPNAFTVQVPAGVDQLQLSYQHLSPTTRAAGRVVMAPAMLNLQWQAVVLYPAGPPATQLRYAPRLKLPADWQWAASLRGRAQSDGWVHFDPVTLDTLIDAPVFAGRHHRAVPLDPPGADKPVVLHLLADDPEQLQAASEAQLQAHRQLVKQADALFGRRPFRHYDFLFAFSETQGPIGLEHAESSENGVHPTYWKDWDKAVFSRELLPHEYTHAWNGKYRRPADQWAEDFNSQPSRNGLLWLYEGQTQFWGRILAVRSGLVTPEQARDEWARLAATVAARTGRQWRNLQDTTNERALGPRGETKQWRDWQRPSDYYDEGALFWLEADARIRERSQGRRSLDDFARLFFGEGAGPLRAGIDGRTLPQLYTFDDVVAALNRVQPFDWAGFLRTRLDTHAQAPLDGLQHSGWRLAWADTPSDAQKAEDGVRKAVDFSHSLGLRIELENAELQGVAWDSPAFRAGLAPGLRLVAVNGVAFKPERLAQAIQGNRQGERPLELLVRDGERFRTVRIDYRGGLRYPRLERVPGTADRLSLVMAPRQG